MRWAVMPDSDRWLRRIWMLFWQISRSSGQDVYCWCLCVKGAAEHCRWRFYQKRFLRCANGSDAFCSQEVLYAESDACVAAENMLLAATSLGIGSCYIGSAWDSFDNPFGHETLQRWGVRTDYYAVLHVLLGHPKDPMDEIKARPRKGERLIWV